MSNLFEVSGLSLANNLYILNGEVNPGNTEATDQAPKGSLYYTSEYTWKKLAAGSGADKWEVENSGAAAGILSITNNPANNVAILDSLDITKVDTAVWSVALRSVANPLNKQVMLITGSHNGADAKYSVFSALTLGTKLPNIAYSVQLQGGWLVLVAGAGVAVDIECYRLTAVSKGSVQVISTGGSGGSTSNSVLLEFTQADIVNDANIQHTAIIPHSLGVAYPQVTVYDDTGLMVIPDEIDGSSTTQVSLKIDSFVPLMGIWHVRLSV